jgi:hypothetical protein
MKQILDAHKGLLVEADFEMVKEESKENIKPEEQEQSTSKEI